MIRIACGLVVLLIAGCVSSGSSIPSPEALSSIVNSTFAGREPEAMANRYGLPHEQKEFNGTRYYVWHANQKMTFGGPDQTVTTTGVIGDPTQYPYNPSVAYKQTTQVPTQETVNYECSMAAEISPGPMVRIVRVRFAGKMGACQVFTP